MEPSTDLIASVAMIFTIFCHQKMVVCGDIASMDLQIDIGSAGQSNLSLRTVDTSFHKEIICHLKVGII